MKSLLIISVFFMVAVTNLFSKTTHQVSNTPTTTLLFENGTITEISVYSSDKILPLENGGTHQIQEVQTISIPKGTYPQEIPDYQAKRAYETGADTIAINSSPASLSLYPLVIAQEDSSQYVQYDSARAAWNWGKIGVPVSKNFTYLLYFFFIAFGLYSLLTGFTFKIHKNNRFFIHINNLFIFQEALYAIMVFFLFWTYVLHNHFIFLIASTSILLLLSLFIGFISSLPSLLKKRTFPINRLVNLMNGGLMLGFIILLKLIFFNDHPMHHSFSFIEFISLPLYLVVCFFLMVFLVKRTAKNYAAKKQEELYTLRKAFDNSYKVIFADDRRSFVAYNSSVAYLFYMHMNNDIFAIYAAFDDATQNVLNCAEFLNSIGEDIIVSHSRKLFQTFNNYLDYRNIELENVP